MSGPRFFLIGAAKSGTTSFARYLDQHPQLYCCRPKEPNFYALEEGEIPSCRGPVASDLLYEQLLKYSVTDRRAYEALFADAPPQALWGDASVRYLYSPNAAVRIARDHPDARLLVLLRDPVDRMYSHFHMNVKLHLEPLSLEAALDAEEQRVADGWGWDWHYARVGEYASQLARYFEHFSPEQVQVTFYDDFQAAPESTLESAFRFLGVEPNFRPDTSHRALVGATPKHRWLRRLVRDDNWVKRWARRCLPQSWRKRVAAKIEKANTTEIPPMSDQLRTAWKQHFHPANEHLCDLLQRKLPWK